MLEEALAQRVSEQNIFKAAQKKARYGQIV